MAGCLLAKAKVAGSNPVFRSNPIGPDPWRSEPGPGLSFSSEHPNIARAHNRSPKAIQMRLERLGLAPRS